MASSACAHIAGLTSVRAPERHECAECVAMGATWVHLRTCQECGATLCCDSSRNRHASAHARAAGHPLVASAEPGERWLYCFADDAYEEY
ncbi:MAG: UBP-type zinc finger domain-containing protein [Gemmatimonadota bacterium]|nr:UBP-type zinc finger domain-containing protein [Gemmatimonadota bacterium]